MKLDIILFKLTNLEREFLRQCKDPILLRIKRLPLSLNLLLKLLSIPILFSDRLELIFNGQLVLVLLRGQFLESKLHLANLTLLFCKFLFATLNFFSGRFKLRH